MGGSQVRWFGEAHVGTCDRTDQGPLAATLGVTGGLTSFMMRSVCLNSGAVMFLSQTWASRHPWVHFAVIW